NKSVVHFQTPSVRSVAVNSSFWVNVQWKNPLSSEAGCNGRVASVPFLFFADDINDLERALVDLVVVGPDSSYSQWKICDENNKPVQTAHSTVVTCDCSQRARTKCRRRYKSAAACGSAWKRISDDTVSLQELSTYFLLLADCKSVHVNLSELNEAMQCVSSLESECPILHRRLRKVRMLSDSPVDVLNHLSSLNGDVSAVLSPMLPILNALDMQSIRMATLYSDFVEKIQKIFPPKLIDPLASDVVKEFLQAIGDNSEMGIAISAAEADRFSDKELIKLWNATVNDWTSGRIDSLSENQGIPYSDVKQLVVSADRLHSLTRQNGASDPFSLLHEYIGQILTTNDSRDEDCLTAAVVIEPLVIYEDSSVTIDVFVQNLQEVTLTNIDLSIDFVRNDMFAPRVEFGVGPSWSAGINTVNGFMHRHCCFHQCFREFLPPTHRLKCIGLGKLLLVIGLQLVHTISYSSLSDVRVIRTDIDVTTSSVAAPFDIVRIELDGKQIGTSLSPLIGSVKSGTSKRITFHITTPGQTANIVNMSTALTVDGQLVHPEDEHIYSIKAAASEKGGFLVSSLANPDTMFFYRPDVGSIVNIVPLQHSATHERSTGDPKKIVILASFRN
ncbi:hypothetical protein NECAME_09047, partial [Necator americanus]